jgi:CheY-specific phosphatase CheX
MDNLPEALRDVFCDVLEKQAFMFAEPALLDELPQNVKGAVVVDIGYSGEHSGSLHLVVPSELARQFVANIVGLDVSDVNDEGAKDALKEILNIVCGNFLTVFYGESAFVSPMIPTVKMMGDDYWQGILDDTGKFAFLVDDIPVMIGIGKN